MSSYNVTKLLKPHISQIEINFSVTFWCNQALGWFYVNIVCTVYCAAPKWPKWINAALIEYKQVKGHTFWDHHFIATCVVLSVWTWSNDTSFHYYSKDLSILLSNPSGHYQLAKLSFTISCTVKHGQVALYRWGWSGGTVVLPLCEDPCWDNAFPSPLPLTLTMTTKWLTLTLTLALNWT